MAASLQSRVKTPTLPELRLVHEHDENFPVALWFLPKAWRHAIQVIYAFARRADDFADEGSYPAEERLAKLDVYWQHLQALENGDLQTLKDPFFLVLNEIIQKHQLPIDPFFDLLLAFKQDVLKSEYANQAELQDYCRHSANPIGRLLLHLTQHDTPDNQEASDRLCTALQLLNFWQDVLLDLRDRQRCYLPDNDLRIFGITPQSILNNSANAEQYRHLIQLQLNHIRPLLSAAAPLSARLRGRFGFQIRFVQHCAQHLHYLLLHRRDYRKRPKLGILNWIYLFLKTLIHTGLLCLQRAVSHV